MNLTNLFFYVLIPAFVLQLGYGAYLAYKLKSKELSIAAGLSLASSSALLYFLYFMFEITNQAFLFTWGWNNQITQMLKMFLGGQGS